MRTLLAAMLLAAAGAACAQDWIAVHGLAKHLDGRIHCNSTTSGLGFERGVTAAFRTIAGFYRNSNCRYSAYAGAAYLPIEVGPVRLGGLAGLVTGYRMSPLPAAGFVAAFEWRRFGIDVVLIPPYNESGNVLWVSAKVPW